MGADTFWRTTKFPPRQALPDGYQVGREWGETRNGGVGYGAWYFVDTKTGDYGDCRRTRWEARRDAIEHSKRT